MKATWDWMRRASLAAVCAASAALLAACGGGGNPTTGADARTATEEGVDSILSQPVSTASFDGTHAWKVSTLAEDSLFVNEVASNGMQTREEGARLVLMTATDGQVKLKQTEPWKGVAWTASESMVADMPQSLAAAQRRVVYAGAWTLIVWVPYDPYTSGRGVAEEPLLARLTGPGVDSGVVQIGDGIFSLHEVLALVSADGKARVYWPDPSTSGTFLNGRFDGHAWLPEAPVTIPGRSKRMVGGQDGQGWLFFGAWEGWSMRKLDAASGLGDTLQLTDPTLGEGDFGLSVQRLANGHLLAVTLQGDHTSRCLLVREFDGLSWGDIQCINELAPAVGVSGSGVDLAVDDSGRAMLIWTDSLDRSIHAAVRSPQGAWTYLGEAANVARLGFSRVAFPFDSKAVIGPGDRYAVVFRTESGATLDEGGVRWRYLHVANWRGTSWGAPERLGDGSVNVMELSAAFDRAGNLGVLSVDRRNGKDAVRFWTKKPGASWADQLLQADPGFNFSSFLGENWLVSDVRLSGLRDGTWAASWTTKGASGDGLRVMGAVLR